MSASSLKFSIENILGINVKKEADIRSSSGDSSDHEVNNSMEAIAPFSWLQCSRIRPPKLPSK